MSFSISFKSEEPSDNEETVCIANRSNKQAPFYRWFIMVHYIMKSKYSLMFTERCVLSLLVIVSHVYNLFLL